MILPAHTNMQIRRRDGSAYTYTEHTRREPQLHEIIDKTDDEAHYLRAKITEVTRCQPRRRRSATCRSRPDLPRLARSGAKP